MKKSERARLLLSIVDRLALEEWPRIDLIVGQFEGSRTDDWQGSKASYVGWSLERVPNESLVELGEFLGLTRNVDVSGSAFTGVVVSPDFERIWGPGRNFRLFLSHVSSAKDAAAKLRDALRYFGATAFVAHVDIQPTKEWLEEIMRALKSMDALAALLTQGFHESNWTDQEIGHALARGVVIVPMKVHADPYGFIGKFQALNSASKSANEAAIAVVRLLLENSATSHAIGDALAHKFFESASYAHAKDIIELLEVPQSLPQASLEVIAKAPQENGQVKGSWGVPDRVRNLLKRHGFEDSAKNAASTDDEIPF